MKQKVWVMWLDRGEFMDMEFHKIFASKESAEKYATEFKERRDNIQASEEYKNIVNTLWLKKYDEEYDKTYAASLKLRIENPEVEVREIYIYEREVES